MTQGKVRQPSHYDIQKVIHKSSPDGYCATRKAEQEPEEEQGKLLEKDVAPKGLGGGGGIRKKKKEDGNKDKRLDAKSSRRKRRVRLMGG